MQDLKVRLLISTVAILIVALLIFFASSLLGRIAVFLAMGALSFVAAFEFSKIAEKKIRGINLPFLLFSCTLFSFSFFAASQDPRFFLAPFILFFIFFVLSFIFCFSEIEGALMRVATYLLAAIFVSFPLGFLILILYFPNQEGKLWLTYLLAVSKAVDVGGYFGGRIFGKRKLAKRISPKKTVEGFLFGIIFALLISIGFSAIAVFSLTFKEALVLGIILALFAQLGDLAESLLKRDAKVKESSKLKGLGGILDILDSLIFNSVILYFFLLANR